MFKQLSTLFLAIIATSVFAAAIVDEVDFGASDDSADANAKRPIISAKTGEDGIIDVSCDDATIADVLRQFRKVTKANIVNPDTTNLLRKVSVELKGVQWLDALQSVLNLQGFRVEERGNIYYIEEIKYGTVTRPYLLNHASAEELADLFNGYKLKTERVTDKNGNSTDTITSEESRFSALSGKVHASAFPNANVLVLTGIESDLIECEKIIKSIDQAATQVYIEARFMELSSEASHQLGVKWTALKSGVSLSYGGNSVESTDNLKDLFTGTLTRDGLSVFLNAFEQVGGTQIFSNPKVIVSNGKEAVIDMTTKFPNLKITSQRNTTSGQTYTDYTAQLEEIRGDKETGLFAGSAFFSWGISLNVKPRISPEGLISVKITPSISELDKEITSDGFYQVQGGSSGDEEKDQAAYGKYPIIKMKSITTDFTMQDGCTAVIGGLSRTEEEDVDTGIPGLRSLPWIGPRIFGWKSREKVQKEIIICVTIGIANPKALKKDVGMPKNAVLGREYLDGKKQEPGDRKRGADKTKSIDTRPLPVMKDTYGPTLHTNGDKHFKGWYEDVDLEADKPAKPEEKVAPVATEKPTEAKDDENAFADDRCPRRRH